MKGIVAHCDKTNVKAEDNIKDAETHLKNVTEKEEYQSIEKTIKNNEANTKHLLKQRKLKKFNYLKYKQNSRTKETTQPTKHKAGFQKTYASVVQGANNANTNVSTTKKFSNTNVKNESQTLLNKLKTLNPNKRPQGRGKSPSRSTSKTRTRTKSKGQRNQKFEKRNTNFETVSNQQHHWRQSTKRADGLHAGRQGQKQHRNNKRIYLYPTNNGNTIGIQRAI